jgi:hypothetical protein
VRSRILLIELPIGKSFPTKLLEQTLVQNGYWSTVLRIALARANDTGRDRKRVELLADIVNGSGISANDLVVYLDERWNGTNFATISGLLERAPLEDPYTLTRDIRLISARRATRAETRSYHLRDSHEEAIRFQSRKAWSSSPRNPWHLEWVFLRARSADSREDHPSGVRSSQVDVAASVWNMTLSKGPDAPHMRITC